MGRQAKSPRVPARRTPRRGRRRTKSFQRPDHDAVAEVDGFRVLALDSSSVAVGWSLTLNGRLHSCGTYRQEGTDHGERLMNFQRWLFAFVQEQGPTHVIYEVPYPGRQKLTFGVLQLYISVILGVHFECFGYEVPEHGRVTA